MAIASRSPLPDTLRIFNRFTGAPIRDVPIPNPFAASGTNPPIGTPGALFLNHAVVSSDGTAYISDQLNSAIFKVDPQGNASVLASGPQLGIRMDSYSIMASSVE